MPSPPPADPGGGGHISDRFLGRVDAYATARPGYPPGLVAWLGQILADGDDVVDLGAGTGLFTRVLLDLGARVRALEPNPEMRASLQERLSGDVHADRLAVGAGTAEHTGLPDRSADLVTAAQAAHWFAPDAARAEFERVLRPDGRVLLVWNDWRDSPSAFNRAYAEVVREFLTPGNEYLDTRVPDERIPELLPREREHRTFTNPVRMDRERLRLLALSASYLPGPDDPRAPELVDALDLVFSEHADGGAVTMEYRTAAYLGR